MKLFVIAAAVSLWGCLPAQEKEERSVKGFHAISVSSAIEVILTISDKESLVFEADAETLKKLQAEVVDGELRLYTKSHQSTRGKMIAYVNAIQVRSMDVSGAAQISLTNTLKTEKLHLETTGAGEVKLELVVKELDAEITGAADVKIKGSAEEVELELSGASDFDGAELAAGNTQLKASGASKAKLRVNGDLKVNASGASSVIYNGAPKNKDIITSGAASVKQG